jgi:hypothetical protein
VPATAGIDFCSKFRFPIYVAIAYNWNDDWVSTGWQKIQPGECLTDPFKVSVSQFYFRGETDWVPTAPGKRTKWTWGNSGRPFPISEKSFTFHKADGPVRGGKPEGFTISMQGDGNTPISESVTFEEDGVHTTQHKTQ